MSSPGRLCGNRRQASPWGRTWLALELHERAAAGCFGLQYPVEIPGVSNLMRSAPPESSAGCAAKEASGAEFMKLVKAAAEDPLACPMTFSSGQ
jgi:Fe-S cluster assembly ATPase SufC